MLKKIDHCNVEALVKVRARILNLGRGEIFHMGHWVQETSCGTMRCIAGWANAMFGNQYPSNQSESAAEHLGLSPEVADMLFQGPTYATAEQAAAAIDNVIEFDNPKWTEVMSHD